ncbi:ubiquitin thioesterase otulin isoform X2 [Rhinatrema bivittatum]|uniref:ubiquitin thioesterase otulin isoform X2 n=1 Tax=Rhinatrema bivittatum TaxID=194408 RepID=UPI00112C0868|nr:ubiquitin thioesterase otulin isoform X2 [Rhinatrema bivittatum]
MRSVNAVVMDPFDRLTALCDETIEKQFAYEGLNLEEKEQQVSPDSPAPLEPEFPTCTAESKSRQIPAAAEKPNASCGEEADSIKRLFPDTVLVPVEMSTSVKSSNPGIEVESECLDISSRMEKRGLVEMEVAKQYCAHNGSASQRKKCRICEKHLTAKGHGSHRSVEHETAGSLGPAEQASRGIAESLPICTDITTVGPEYSLAHSAARLSESCTASEVKAPLASQGDAAYVAGQTSAGTTKSCKEGPGDGSDFSAMESSVDNEEDIYRDAKEIEKENKAKKSFPLEDDASGKSKLSVMPEINIVEYCRKEWRGETEVAERMKKGYEAVSQSFDSIRRVRGDNYCALRATLFQALSQAADLPAWLESTELTQLPAELIRKYNWLKHWKLPQLLNKGKNKNLSNRITEYLELLKTKWADLSEIKCPEVKQAACEETFRNEDEYSLYEALKFLMLSKAVELYNDNAEGKEVPVFSWLLFARNTSSTPCDFMKNHLNQVGHMGGLEQVEMFLLGYALQHTIKVYRLYKFETDEFITLYPNDQKDWPVVTLITEDDRHYNVPVRVYEGTSL